MPDVIDYWADWQWNVHAWSKQDHPASAINHYLATQALRQSSATWFSWLCYGQRHHPGVLDAYRHYRDEYGDQQLILAILTACAGHEPDLAEANVHLEWQAHHEPYTLVTASRRWEHAGDQPAAAIAAYYTILAGQIHNASACQIYRACLAAEPERLMTAVKQYTDKLAAGELVHPYLLGQSPNATCIRDQVPPDPDGAIDESASP